MRSSILGTRFWWTTDKREHGRAPRKIVNASQGLKGSFSKQRLSLALLLGVGLAVTGCQTVKREVQDENYLLQRRAHVQRVSSIDAQQRFLRLIEHTKAQYDQQATGERNAPPVIDILIISGGGDWGAFGAGFLKGWGKIPKSHPMSRPEFDIVTGVSTGALIAPFAFVGDHESIETIVQLYRNPKKDWVKKRGPFSFLPTNLSLAKVPGLERELKKNVSPELISKIAEAARDQRILAVNTTSLDDASPRVFFLNTEAQRAIESGDLTRIHNIMLASAGIPGAFPYREIDGEMYVDGGVTGNIIYGGRLSEEESLPALWQLRYPNTPIPKIRYWVIFNNQMRAPPTVVPARWIEIVTRSVGLSTRSATLTALRHLHAMSEISRLKRNADVEVRTVMIPDDWRPPAPGPFVKETMNKLADIGEQMGADVSSWSTEPPAP